MQSVQKELFYDDVVEILENFSREKAYKSKVPYLPPPNVLDDAIIK